MNAFSFPNLLSASRLAAAPLLAAIFWLPLWTETPQRIADFAAAALFLLAASTDFMDGYLARRTGRETRLGAFLDPVADKILVAAALIVLIEAERAAAVAGLLIITREIFVSALREWAALAGQDAAVRVSAAGKWKTAIQMIAVPCLFVGDELRFLPFADIGNVALWAAAGLAVLSMAAYCFALQKPRQ